ncbi:TniQ family protein [Stenotrophomonas indicatrix]|uniref:TniQ family protein n=1 Tax=Stenotrophomonas indicatrix TaxID=2045451 RepID=UPI003CE54F60
MVGTPSLAQSELFPFHRGVFPVEGELLSSYLLRLAGAHSADHYRFYSSLLPRVQLWNRDIDRASSGQVAQLLVDRCRLTPATVDGLSLRSYELAISGPDLRVTPGRGTWINPVGIFHRTRTLAGLQVCPHCLAEAKVYRRIWRLSFVTCCPYHLVPLNSVCPGCSAPIVPHRQLPGTSVCHSCHIDHLSRTRYPVELVAIPPGQQMLMSALAGGTASTLSGRIPLADLVRGIGLLRRWGMFRVPMCAKGVGIESQSPFVRWVYFDLIHELISQWPDSMARLMVKGRISRQMFDQSKPPAWLTCIRDQLSLRHSSKLRAEPQQSLASWLRYLKQTKPDGWREMRASALTKAVRK